jgi:hypothetical protein
MVHVAVPELNDPVDAAQVVIPAVPVTVQVTAPVGAAPPVGPESVAVKVTLEPSVVGVELVTPLVAVAWPTVTVSLLEMTLA